uniref:Nicotinate glucosyltransferase n=1 Tax=Opuntia streptacantha TaxID=393608 RepID=A0A7C9DZQ7_OPUST
MTPMIHLANVLHSNGFSIVIIHTCFNSSDPSKFPNFAFHFIEDVLWKAKDPPSDIFKILHELNASCSDPFRACSSASKAKELVACLILDPFWNFAAAVAEELKLPRIALRTGGILAFILKAALPLLREKGHYPLQGTSDFLLIKEQVV